MTPSPFEDGEVCEPVGTFPKDDRYGMMHGQSGSGQGKESPQSEERAYRSPVAPVPATPDTVNTSLSSTFSVTPRNLFLKRGQSSTPTPAAQLANIPIDFDGINDEGEDDGEEWGDDALLRWDGIEEIDTGDEVSSVPPEDAGVSDEETWGRDAVIDFTLSSDEKYDSGENSEEELTGVETIAVVDDETIEELRGRGMPDYSQWDIRKLQVSRWTICNLIHIEIDRRIWISTNLTTVIPRIHRHAMLACHPPPQTYC